MGAHVYTVHVCEQMCISRFVTVCECTCGRQMSLCVLTWKGTCVLCEQIHENDCMLVCW